MDEFDDILILIEREKFKLAISKINERLPQNSDDFRVYMLLSMCHFGLKDFKKSRFFIQEAMRLEPEVVEILNLYAEIEIEEKNYGRARELLSISAKINPSQEELFILKTKLALECNDINEAVNNSKLLLKLDPLNSYGRNILALDLILKNKFREADNIIESILSKAPWDGFALSNLSLVKLFTNRVDESRNLLERALKHDPENDGMKEGLKLAIISKNYFANLLFKLNFFTERNSKVFRLIVGISFRVIFITAVIFNSVLMSRTGIENIILIVMLGLYVVLFIPFKILPQVFNLVLYFDRVGKYLISKKEKRISSAVLMFLLMGAIFILRYFLIENSIESNSQLISGMLLIFISGLFSDMLIFDDQKNQEVLKINLGISSFLLILFLTLPEAKIVWVSLMIIFIWLYPIILKLNYE